MQTKRYGTCLFPSVDNLFTMALLFHAMSVRKDALCTLACTMTGMLKGDQQKKGCDCLL